MQFYDSEIKVLNILWRYGELAAGEVQKILGEGGRLEKDNYLYYAAEVY